MRRVSLTAAALLATTSIATAGGIDRSGQGVNILFEEGDYAQFTFSRVNPNVDGTGVGAFAGQPSNNVLPGYNALSFGYKHQLTDNVDLAIIIDQPFGAHVRYTDGPLSAGGAAGLPYNGEADIDSRAITGLVQYHFNENFSVHGGIRAQKVEGIIRSGKGILEADSDYNFGGVVGVAYERPDIALRVALTYSSGIENEFSGKNAAFPPGFDARNFDVKFPESVNLDFQTGIAKDTLLFGNIRWVGWDGFNLSTAEDGEWVSFDDDTITYTLGIGRRINEQLSLAVTFGYESAGSVPTTSALTPTSGSKSIGFGGTYQATEALSISGGITYAVPGDQTYQAGPAADLADIDFSGDAWGAGIRIGYRF